MNPVLPKTEAQDNRHEPVQMNIAFRTFGSDTVARHLISVWDESEEVTDDNRADMQLLAFVLSVTHDADIGSLKGKIPDTQVFLDWFASLRGDSGLLTGLTDDVCLDILKRFNTSVPIIFLWNVWIPAYNKAQLLFPSEKTIVPESQLTDEERADETLKKSEN